MTGRVKKERSFEDAMTRLEVIVAELEGEDRGLEKQFALFQEGMELAQQGWLAGVPGSRRVIINRRNEAVEDVAAIRAPHATSPPMATRCGRSSTRARTSTVSTLRWASVRSSARASISARSTRIA